MTAYLTFNGESGAESVPCGAVTTIGRDRSNDVVLPDLQVSRHHAMVRRLGQGDYYLIDSGSANGSRLNERRLTTPTLLHHADRISIGTTEFVFELGELSPAFTDSLSFQATLVMDAPLIKEITILVADMRGFSRLSEQLSIQSLTRVMNAWFELVSSVIAKHGGTVDKFIGDCVFARWEHQDSRENVINALKTAGEIQEVTAGLCHTFPELSVPPGIGVGIHTGMASLGVGSDNTALGDAVNTAFRLETATKALRVDIVLSEHTASLLPFRQELGNKRSIRVKGKEKPVNVIGLKFGQAEALLDAVVSE